MLYQSENNNLFLTESLLVFRQIQSNAYHPNMVYHGCRDVPFVKPPLRARFFKPQPISHFKRLIKSFIVSKFLISY